MSAAVAFAKPPVDGNSPADVRGKRHPRFVWQSAVAFDQRLEAGAVRLYIALDDYAGYAGKCHPHQSTLARRLRVSDRTIRRWLTQLNHFGYATVRRTGRGSWYTLGWVGADSDQTRKSDQRPDKDVRSDRTSVSAALKEEPRSWTGGPSSSSSTAGESMRPQGKDDDDQKPPREEKTQKPQPAADALVNAVGETLVAWAADKEYKLSGPIPAEAIAQRMREGGAGLPALKNFLYYELPKRQKSFSAWEFVRVCVQNEKDLANFDQSTYGKSSNSYDYESAREYARVKEESIRGGQRARRSR